MLFSRTLRGAKVRREIEVPATPDEVWDLLCSPDGLGEWLADSVDAESITPGEEAVFHFGDDARVAFIEDVVESERLAFSWRRRDGERSHVVLTVRAVSEDSTRVVVTETAPAFAAPVAIGLGALSASWAGALSRLRLVVGRAAVCA